MYTRLQFLTYSITGLLLTVLPGLAVADPSPATATDIVQQFVTARSAGRSSEAYGLLATNSGISAQDFDHGMPASALIHADEDGMTPITTAVSVFFMDTKNVCGYKFEVVGPDPSDTATVLVRALPPKTPAQKSLLLKIVTSQDDINHAPRLHLMKTYERTSPEGFIKMRDQARQMASISNLRQISLALLMYAQDHGGHLPDADKWVDAIMPLAKVEALFRDPYAPEGKTWSYAFNRNLSGAKLSDLLAPSNTIMLFESTLGTKNANDLGASIPHPGRYNGGTDYALADGHVKWFPDNETQSEELNWTLK